MNITKEWCEQKIKEYLLKDEGKLEYVVEFYQIDEDGHYEMIHSDCEWWDEASIAPYREIWDRLIEDFYADGDGDDSEEALDEYMHEYFLNEVEFEETEVFGDGIPQTVKIFINPDKPLKPCGYRFDACGIDSSEESPKVERKYPYYVPLSNKELIHLVTLRLMNPEFELIDLAPINPELYARIMYYTRDTLFKHKEHVAEMTAVNNIAEEILAE